MSAHAENSRPQTSQREWVTSGTSPVWLRAWEAARDSAFEREARRLGDRRREAVVVGGPAEVDRPDEMRGAAPLAGALGRRACGTVRELVNGKPPVLGYTAFGVGALRRMLSVCMDGFEASGRAPTRPA